MNYSCAKHKEGYASFCERCQDQYREWRAWKAEQGEDDCVPPVLLVPESSQAGVKDGASPLDTSTTPPPFRGKYHKKFTEKPKPKRDRRSQDERWKALEFEIDRLTREKR